jgi:hypothetical protein
MLIPSECHMTLYETVDCVVNPLPLKDLPIVGQSDKKAEAIMHGDEGIAGEDGLKELDPHPSEHDGIHTLVTSWNKLRVTFRRKLYLSCLSSLTTSFLLSSEDNGHFPLSKSRQPMATLMAIPTIFANH